VGVGQFEARRVKLPLQIVLADLDVAEGHAQALVTEQFLKGMDSRKRLSVMSANKRLTRLFSGERASSHRSPVVPWHECGAYCGPGIVAIGVNRYSVCGNPTFRAQPGESAPTSV
jgi:hypothetical protein